MADRLDFKLVGGKWHNGNDFADVEVVRITGTSGAKAFLYTCHVNIDYDGAANAYGPRDKSTLDSLEDAGYQHWWYGLVSVHPNGRLGDYNDDSWASFNVGTKGANIKTAFDLELDTRYPDSRGRLPVVQKSGPYKGYFIAATPHYHSPDPSRKRKLSDMYNQASYTDASSVAFAALGGQLSSKGAVNLKDFGLAIRHDQPRQSAFFFDDMGSTSGYQSQALAECSYKVHLDLGGETKRPGRTPNNNYPVSFLVFPGSGSGATAETDVRNGVSRQLTRLSNAENAYELPLLMSFAAAVGKGASGLPQLEAYRKTPGNGGGGGVQPASVMNVDLGLARFGFRGGLFSGIAGTVADVVNAVLP
jgi:hypothetical protein